MKKWWNVSSKLGQTFWLSHIVDADWLNSLFPQWETTSASLFCCLECVAQRYVITQINRIIKNESTSSKCSKCGNVHKNDVLTVFTCEHIENDAFTAVLSGVIILTQFIITSNDSRLYLRILWFYWSLSQSNDSDETIYWKYEVNFFKKIFYWTNFSMATI